MAIAVGHLTFATSLRTANKGVLILSGENHEVQLQVEYATIHLKELEEQKETRELDDLLKREPSCFRPLRESSVKEVRAGARTPPPPVWRSIGPRRGVVTLGDSILDSGRYSGGPGTSAPEILAHGIGAELHHLARDGHTAKKVLDQQLARLPLASTETFTVLVVSAGGNDLLYAVSIAHSETTVRYRRWLSEILVRAKQALRPDVVLVTNIYDPGDDLRKVLTTWRADPAHALALLRAYNEVIAAVATEQCATLVDLHAAFTPEHAPGSADPWIVARIEPSAAGAREIARLLRAAVPPEVL